MAENSWKITACPHDCPCGCAMRARLFDGKLEIEPHAPYTKFICAKGLRWRERVFSERRLRKPLLRDGAGWRELSWDAAFDIWARKIESAVAHHGALSLMFLSGAGSLYYSKPLVKSVFAELGGYTGTTGSLCSSIGGSGVKECKNSHLPAFVPPEALEKANAMLFWGRNVYETLPHIIPIINKNNVKLGTIEIRESATAKMSEKFWRVAPGGDWAIAAWLCRALIERGLDSPNWRERVKNSAPFESYVLSLPPEMLLSQSGFTNESAEELLKWLVGNAPVCHFPAYGAQRYLHGNLQHKWIFALAVLTGAFENVAAAYAGSKDERALFPEGIKSEPRDLRTFPAGCWSERIGECAPPVEVLMIMNANPLRQTPDTAATMRAFSKIPFKVCSELFMTETAELCDLVLPTCSFLEESDFLGSYWHSYIVESEAVIPPVGESKTDIEIYDGLAKALGLSIDLEEKKRLIGELIFKKKNEKNLRKVGERIYFWDEPNYWTDKKSCALLPVEIPKAQSETAERTHRTYKKRLITVHRAEYINGQSDEVKLPNPPEIFLNPSAIENLGFKIGQVAEVCSSNGQRLKMRLREDASLAENCAVAFQGQSGINLLTNALSAPGDGAPYAECFVEIIATSG